MLLPYDKLGSSPWNIDIDGKNSTRLGDFVVTQNNCVAVKRNHVFVLFKVKVII